MAETHAPHRAFVEHWHLDDTYDVGCRDCDFEVLGLGTIEAAEDTKRWHQGEPSHIGMVLRLEEAKDARRADVHAIDAREVPDA